jgi:hypothetical protein
MKALKMPISTVLIDAIQPDSQIAGPEQESRQATCMQYDVICLRIHDLFGM